MRAWSLLALFSFFSSAALAEEAHPVRASLVSESLNFVPGQPLTVGLRLEQEKGWHTYWSDPGDAGLPTSVEWALPKGVEPGALQWPKPKVFKDPDGLKGYGYEDEVLLPVALKVAPGFKAEKLLLKVQATWLACREVCIPGGAELTLSLPKGKALQASGQAALFEAVRPSLGQAPEAGSKAALGWMLLLALLGGLLLNLMPCVLPVLGLKALSFVEQSHETRAQGLRLAAAFGAGVLASFWALAGLVLLLKSGGQAVGWGFQFQEPGFVLFMAALVLAFSLNLFGVFEIWLPGGAMQGLSKASQKQGLYGAFGHGMVMTLLATPCTAPFLGTALGFAFSASAFELLAVFSAVAIGLALPYAALAAIPGAHAWLPKPGPWMTRFKEAMGFLLLATVAWLVWLLGKMLGTDALAQILAWLLIVAVAAWAWGAWGGVQHKKEQRLMLALGLAALLGISGAFLLPKALGSLPSAPGASLGQGWVAWDKAELEKLRAQGRPVFVDFTADWCWTCKVNEKAVLGREDVQAAFKAKDAVLMKADWTRRDLAISAELKSHGRSGVPLYVWYGVKKEAKVLPEVITPGLLLQALN